jgi:ArsR family transcriptional regulator
MYLSNLLKILGDETRLRIMNLLTKQEVCVCLIEQVLEIPQPNVSKHLNRLRQYGIISCRRIAQWCFYSLSESFRNQYADLLAFFMSQWKSGQYAKDMKKLEYLLEANDCCRRLLEQANNGQYKNYPR